MEAGPHPLIERSIARLVPPLAREAVMGDLAERFRSPPQYLAEAFSTLPLVIFGQIRRTTTLAVVGLEAVILFGCMGGFGNLTEIDREVPMWARAALPATLALLSLVLRDAYRAVEGWSAGRAFADVMAVSAVIGLWQLGAAALAAGGIISADWLFMAQRLVVMAISILPTLFVIRLGLGLDGDSRLQEPTGALTVGELRADYARFATRVRTRNLLEIAIFGGMALAGAVFLLFAQGLANTALGWCWFAGQMFVCWYLFTQASARPIPVEAAFVALVAFYRTEIARQRRLVRFIWWWYLWPLCIGVGMPLIARAAEHAAYVALGLACVALPVTLVAKFGQERARAFADEMDILSALEERS